MTQFILHHAVMWAASMFVCGSMWRGSYYFGIFTVIALVSQATLSRLFKNEAGPRTI